MESVSFNTDPNVFDLSVRAILEGLGAEKYIDIFRTKNIGQSTLVELNDEDLAKLGIDDEEIRKKIIEDAKTLPIYEELTLENYDSSDLNIVEIKEMVGESAQQIYRIYLSMISNKLALIKTKNVPDCLLHRNLYASDIALSTLREIETILNALELTIHTKLKVRTRSGNNFNKKKIIVGVVGSSLIITLSLLFISSLKKL